MPVHMQTFLGPDIVNKDLLLEKVEHDFNFLTMYTGNRRDPRVRVHLIKVQRGYTSDFSLLMSHVSHMSDCTVRLVSKNFEECCTCSMPIE